VLPTRCQPSHGYPRRIADEDEQRDPTPDAGAENPPATAEAAAAPPAKRAEQETTAQGVLLGFVVIVALLAGIGYGIAQLAPDHAPQKKNPNFIDSIFDNVVVIAAARVLLLIAAVVALIALVYIGVSAAVRLARGEWLQRAGPFEPKLEEVAESLDAADSFFEEWLEVTEENEQLTERLEQRDQAIRELLAERELLVQELKRLSGT
jgi:hypothetical protein